MAKSCDNCGVTPISSKAKYCSDKCKQEAYRNRAEATTVTDVTLSHNSVTVTPEEPVTVRPAQAMLDTSGKSWCCGEDIGPGLVCCGPCAWSGKAKEKRAGQYPPLPTDRTPAQMEADLHSKELTGPGLVIGVPGDDDYDGTCTQLPT